MLNEYKNPVTTQENINELHHILVQSCLDYMVKHELTDIDEISFTADGLRVSYNYKEWTPATDSSLVVIGIQKDDDNKYPERRIIGQSM